MSEHAERVLARITELRADALLNQINRKPASVAIDRLCAWQESGEATPDQLRALITVVWVTMNRLSMHAVKLVPLLRTLGFLSDTDGIQPPTSAQKLYRGISPWGEARGLSWTTNVATAEWYARRFQNAREDHGAEFKRMKLEHSVGTILTAEVPCERVLAVFNCRGECEVAVDAQDGRRDAFAVRPFRELPGLASLPAGELPEHNEFVRNYARYRC